jgi:5-formyltetrahydrofolate cyclo-ligase
MKHHSATSFVAAKIALRREMRAKLSALSSEFRAEASLVICELTARHKAFRAARAIALFSPLLTEPDIHPLIEEAWAARKHVALPRLSDQKSRPCLAWHRVESWADLIDDGPFSLLEPCRKKCPLVEAKELEAVFVPGLAFDSNGRRLGRGGGYYDRFLSALDSTVPRIGLMFDVQRVDEVPTGPHDQALPAIITEEGLVGSTISGAGMRSIQPPPSTSSPT